MKVLITGSTGFVGSSLVSELKRAGHTVCRLIRPASSAGAVRGSEGFDVGWDPATGELGPAAVGADAVVNLGGASVAKGRWTPKRKQLLRSSRVDTTRALVQALAKMAARPRALVSASGIGYYGNRGDETLYEQSAPGNDFPADLARDWEAEAIKAEVLGIRVVCVRFGVVLGRDGGALPMITRPFRLGFGGRLGSGRQWMSWVALQDAVSILRLAIENGSVRGPLNAVSPQPVRNADFTSCLANVLHRPALFPAPAFALRIVMGEMADALLLASQRVEPAYLKRLGYAFLQPELESAFRAILS
jgi:uncharacterized protein (TIGR01777 family)